MNVAIVGRLITMREMSMKYERNENYYVVIDDDLYGKGEGGGSIDFQCKDQAIEYCLHNRIPSFYELSPINPLDPVRVWNVWPGKNGGKFQISSQLWKDAVAAHDGGCDPLCTCHLH